MEFSDPRSFLPLKLNASYRWIKRKAPARGRGAECIIKGRRLHRKRLAMVGRCTRLTVCSLVLCFGGSAGAQERGKTLYAAQCERCHKSPQDVTTFHGGVDLETFLGELHYADTPESAASIAAYLKGLAGASASRRSGKEAPDPQPTNQAEGRSEPLSASAKPTRSNQRRPQ